MHNQVQDATVRWPTTDWCHWTEISIALLKFRIVWSLISTNYEQTKMLLERIWSSLLKQLNSTQNFISTLKYGKITYIVEFLIQGRKESRLMREREKKGNNHFSIQHHIIFGSIQFILHCRHIFAIHDSSHGLFVFIHATRTRTHAHTHLYI
jgi:hypothetical protein